MSIGARVLWAVLLAWVTIDAIRGPSVSTVGGAVSAYVLAYMALTD